MVKVLLLESERTGVQENIYFVDEVMSEAERVSFFFSVISI